MHHDSTTIIDHLNGGEPDAGGTTEHIVTLAEGDSAWNPASTSRAIYGPATVIYTRYVDGGIVVRVI